MLKLCINKIEKGFTAVTVDLLPEGAARVLRIQCVDLPRCRWWMVERGGTQIRFLCSAVCSHALTRFVTSDFN